jgi:hypothetical protein
MIFLDWKETLTCLIKRKSHYYKMMKIFRINSSVIKITIHKDKIPLNINLRKRVKTTFLNCQNKDMNKTIIMAKYFHRIV